MATGDVMFRVTGNIDYNGEYWISRCNELKLVAYGKTANNADKRMIKAIDLWVKALSELNLVPSRLKELGVTFVTLDSRSIPTVHFVKREGGVRDFVQYTSKASCWAHPVGAEA